MGTLRVTIAAIALVFARLALADPVTRWRPYTSEASIRFGVPIDWIERVMWLESGGRTTWRGRPITSSAGAMGLMQLMPATWLDMRNRYGLGVDPYDPHDNIVAGTAYLRLMYDRFGYPGLFGAYNAGPGRYNASLSGRTLPLETRVYLAALGDRSGATVRTGAAATVFVDRGQERPSASPSSARSSLFVPLSIR